MNILMLTNTYKPHVGGVARSVEAFAEEYRSQGHRVLIVAPEFDNEPDREDGVLRVPAIQRFNGSDFSVHLPIPGLLTATLEDFRPEIVHSHHPFLLGDTALRVASKWNVPLVFTHHTMYERYTHYVPGDSPALQQFAIELSTAYANMCDRVFAPSESVANILRDRGVQTPTVVVATGVDVARFASGDGPKARWEMGIPQEAFVVGHVGRLAPEKNLPFLAEAVAAFLRRHPQACFLVVGSGPSGEDIQRICDRSRVAHRLYLAGIRKGQELIDAYHAMDTFAFASHTETQGMVLTEAMAAGLPVVALEASGVRDVVRDGGNGRLLACQHVDEFVEALTWVFEHRNRPSLVQGARETAAQFSRERCAELALEQYEETLDSFSIARIGRLDLDDHLWQSAQRRLETEWRIWTSFARAAHTALRSNRVPYTPLLARFARSIDRARQHLRMAS